MMRIASDAEIYFYEQETISIFFESFASGDHEKLGEIALSVLYTLRMISNLGANNEVTYDLGMMLLKIPSDIEKIASGNELTDFQLIQYPGHKGRKYFTAMVRMDDKGVNFDFKAKGFGLFGKGLNYYGPISVFALIRYLATKRADDEEYLNSLARSISRCGYLRKNDKITLTNQTQLAIETIFTLCGQYLIGLG